ncbi:MAG: RHS repeat-associated core domain-containing protein [Candidatus Nitronauta litoralis]|uniref:RHS repeat-associated core domain-containing protein n=1 Tax=Candidatus Nitronauta litoralis TaxID=2705533 RepID=A0A7T0G0R6_9BACT|nr:MAG: RHS repeat-associated core domain-containing protein [Candidatus Nitronauta litoralis]
MDRLNNGAVYDVQDRLTANSTATYTYNDNGELATKVDASGTTTYTYDVLGNLRQVDPPLTNDVIDYIIDGSNRRIAKKVNGTITKKWLYGDPLNPIAELDLNDNITKRFIYGTRSNVPDVMVDVSGANPVVYRIISDHLGSPRFVIDISNGTTALELSYDEWGVETIVSGNRDLIPFGFAGGLYDKDTKLVRFGARDYDPEIGRWTSKDPIEFEGGDTNLFGYVLNDPVNYIDPTGNCPWCVKIGIEILIEIAIQMTQNGGKIECIDWEAVGKAAVGAVLPPGVARAGNGSKFLPKGGTYKLKTPDGGVKRTGRSKDLERRKKEHKRDPQTKDLEFEVDKRTDSYDAQRGREQIVHDQHPEARVENGGLNKKNPIGDRNRNRKKYMDSGGKL